MAESAPSLPVGTKFVAAGVFSLTFVGFLRAPLLPSIGRELEFGAFGIGLIVAAFGLGRVLVDLPAGGATDRHSVGSMMAAASAIVAGGAAVMAAAVAAWMVLAGAVLMGIGSSLASAAAIAFFASAPRESRGTSVSMYGASLLTAQAFGPFVAGFAALVLDWRAVVFGGAALAGTAAAMWSRAQSAEINARSNRDHSLGPQTTVPRRVLWVVYALPAVQFGVGAAVLQTLIPIIGEDELRFSTGTVGLALGLGGAVRLVSALSAGRLSDAAGRKAVLVPSLTFQMLGLAVLFADIGAAGWWLTIFLLTVGSIAANVGGTMIADLSEGGPLGRRLGRFRLVGDLALMSGPLVTGWLFSRYGLRVSVAPLGLMSVAILIATLSLPETGGSPPITTAAKPTQI